MLLKDAISALESLFQAIPKSKRPMVVLSQGVLIETALRQSAALLAQLRSYFEVQLPESVYIKRIDEILDR